MKQQCRRLKSRVIALAALLGLAGMAWAASTGTVVTAKSTASAQIKVVGTTTIVVLGGATAQDVKAQLEAKDKSPQTYVVTDEANSREDLRPDCRWRPAVRHGGGWHEPIRVLASVVLRSVWNLSCD